MKVLDEKILSKWPKYVVTFWVIFTQKLQWPFLQRLEKFRLLLIPTSGHTGWKVPTKPTCLLEKVSTSLGIKSV